MKGIEMKPYDEDERELMESIENEEWLSIGSIEEEIKKAREAARLTTSKTERMNIRISSKDLRRLKIRAIEEGVPYQTLVSSIIHKYLAGRLAERRD